MHLLLGVEETACHWIGHQLFAVLLELGDFVIVQRHAHLLLLLEGLTLFHDELILTLRLFAGHEAVQTVANQVEIRLFEDGLAKLAGFADDQSFFKGGFHN